MYYLIMQGSVYLSMRKEQEALQKFMVLIILFFIKFAILLSFLVIIIILYARLQSNIQIYISLISKRITFMQLFLEVLDVLMPTCNSSLMD